MPSTKPIEWTYAVVGDIGTKYSAPFVQHQLLHDNRLEGLIHPGDIGYVTSNEAFNEFLSGMAELVARVPYQVIAGNHEQLSEASFSSRWSTDEFASRSGSVWWQPRAAPGLGSACLPCAAREPASTACLVGRGPQPYVSASLHQVKFRILVQL